MPDLKTILVVDDDPKIRTLLRRCFEMEAFAVLEAQDWHGVERILDSKTVHLVTLDLNLGVESGLTIAGQIRARTDVPIVMVSGKGDVIDKVVGLELGADDYISKPFHLREVLARLKSILRHSENRVSEPCSLNVGTSARTKVAKMVYGFEGWTADPSAFKLVSPAGNEVELTSGDFKLLTVFLDAPKRVLSREHIMDLVNGIGWNPLDRTIDNQVARLRKKIETEPSNPSIIKTVRGVGYSFAVDVSKSEAQV